MAEIEKLKEQNQKLEAELADMIWASQKTNEGVRILYKDLERKNQELKTLDQMKSKFLAVVSHELRTPITIMMQATENILAGAFGEVTGKQQKWIQRIQDNALRLAGLVNDILDFSKLQSGTTDMRRGLVDLEDLVSSVVENMKGLAQQKSVELSGRLSTMPQVYGTRTRIEQVLSNLISNALKFSPAGGKIEVEARWLGQKCQITVSDMGPGIDAENIEKIFLPFVQTNRESSQESSMNGVGLGLAICQEIVSQHRGEIWAESEIGKGSRFIFTLPVDPRSEVNRNA